MSIESLVDAEEADESEEPSSSAVVRGRGGGLRPGGLFCFIFGSARRRSDMVTGESGFTVLHK